MMSIDTPATIAIIGAGPIGLEAALYARYLGYDVLLFDRGPVAANVLAWGQQRMTTPFCENVSKLGLAALHAQDPRWRPPSAKTLLTGAEWRAAYLAPLAQSDLIVDSLRERMEIVAVERLSEVDADAVANEAEGGEDDDALEPDEPLPPNFSLQARRTDGEAIETVMAHVVIDASGLMNLPGQFGGGSERVAGETAASGDAEHSGADPGEYQALAPDFYCLGAKSFARYQAAEFSFANGLEQIRRLFAMLMDRAALDLYATMDKLLPN